MAWVGRDLKDHEAPTPPPQAGPPTSTFNTRPGCPGKAHPVVLIIGEVRNPEFLDNSEAPLVVIINMTSKGVVAEPGFRAE